MATVTGIDELDALLAGAGGTGAAGGTVIRPAAHPFGLIRTANLENASGGTGDDTLRGGGGDVIDGGAGNDWVTLEDRGGTVTLAGVETLIGGLGGDFVILSGGGNTITLAAVETLIGGAGGDRVTLGDRGATMILAAIETLIGGAGLDRVSLGARGGTITVSGVETLSGGTGLDRVLLGAAGVTMVVTGVETITGGAATDSVTLAEAGGITLGGVEIVIGSGGGDSVRFDDAGGTAAVWAIETLTGGSGVESLSIGTGAVRFQGNGGADLLTLPSGAADQIAFASMADGSGPGTGSGYDRVFGFASGDTITLSGTLGDSVDRDGNGSLTVATRGTNGADATTDEVVLLSGYVQQLADPDFTWFRGGLGTVAGTSPCHSLLVLATDSLDTGVYVVSDTGDGVIASGEVRLLAVLHGTLPGMAAVTLA